MTELHESQHDLELNFSMGFSAADFEECGPVLFGYGLDPNLVRDKVQALHAEVAVTRRGDWLLDLLDPSAAVEKAMALASTANAPVVIADTQDNPGAGGDSNTTGMLHALLAADAGVKLGGRVAIGLMFDPESAQAACAAGVGATLGLNIGRAVRTWTGELTEPPVSASAKVLAISDGVVPMHGPMTAGATMRLGPSACVDVRGIRVLLTSAKAQMLDLDLYRFLGVEPSQMKLLVNKSSVHFRAAFGPIASTILVAKSPGPMAADPADLPWKNLSPETATGP
jgi:microcystin degradation protein MlrC